MFIKRDKFKIKIYYCKGYYDDIFVGEMILNSEQFQKNKQYFYGYSI